EAPVASEESTDAANDTDVEAAQEPVDEPIVQEPAAVEQDAQAADDTPEAAPVDDVPQEVVQEPVEEAAVEPEAAPVDDVVVPTNESNDEAPVASEESTDAANDTKLEAQRAAPSPMAAQLKAYRAAEDALLTLDDAPLATVVPSLPTFALSSLALEDDDTGAVE
ncbi:hypothetical protein SPRG_18783, partial [Saprolegnia parasitica CBS 223.65]